MYHQFPARTLNETYTTANKIKEKKQRAKGREIAQNRRKHNPSNKIPCIFLKWIVGAFSSMNKSSKTKNKI